MTKITLVPVGMYKLLAFERVEISPVSVVLELQDDQDEHFPIQEATVC